MNTNDIKIFFFDIDSTTFDHSIFAVRKTTMDALKLLKESGYKICISTSRSIAEVLHFCNTSTCRNTNFISTFFQ